MKSEIDFDIKAFQKECLYIMSAFDESCRHEGLRYYMACGTMIGAVRHKGFIPWDDDVDVYMPRPDFERMKANAATILPKNLKLVDYSTDSTFPHFYAKIEDTNTTKIERIYLNHYSGVWIDIFPVDGITDNKLARRIHTARFKFWRRLQYLVYRDPWKHGHNFGGYLVLGLHKMFPKQYVHRHIQKVMRQYDFESHDTLMPHNDHFVTFTKEELGMTPVDYDFEGHKFYGVKDYDAYLRRIYGDYMTPPPPEKQVVKHNIVFCDLNMPVAEYIEKYVNKKQHSSDVTNAQP